MRTTQKGTFARYTFHDAQGKAIAVEYVRAQNVGSAHEGWAFFSGKPRVEYVRCIVTNSGKITPSEKGGLQKKIEEYEARSQEQIAVFSPGAELLGEYEDTFDRIETLTVNLVETTDDNTPAVYSTGLITRRNWTAEREKELLSSIDKFHHNPPVYAYRDLHGNDLFYANMLTIESTDTVPLIAGYTFTQARENLEATGIETIQAKNLVNNEQRVISAQMVYRNALTGTIMQDNSSLAWQANIHTIALAESTQAIYGEIQHTTALTSELASAYARLMEAWATHADRISTK